MGSDGTGFVANEMANEMERGFGVQCVGLGLGCGVQSRWGMLGMLGQDGERVYTHAQAHARRAHVCSPCLSLCLGA